MTTTTETTVADTLTIQRPEGVSDARWGTLASLAEMVVSGHAPWCNDHHDADDGDPLDGWCRYTEEDETAGGAVRVQIANGTMDGRAVIDIVLADGSQALTELTPFEAYCIGDTLRRAAHLAKMGNLAAVEEARS
jgi:hypothetical protein